MARNASAFSGSFTANADLRSNAVVLFGTERDIKQAKLGKSRLENDIEEAKANPPSADPLERYISENRLHPRAASFLARELAVSAAVMSHTCASRQ